MWKIAFFFFTIFEAKFLKLKVKNVFSSLLLPNLTIGEIFYCHNILLCAGLMIFIRNIFLLNSRIYSLIIMSILFSFSLVLHPQIYAILLFTYL